MGSPTLKWRFVLYIVAFVALSIVNSVSRKLMYDGFGSKLVFFRQQLTNFLYDIYASVVVIYKLCGGRIADSARATPLWKFAAIGFLDGFADFGQSVGGVNTPGNWQTLIQQLPIPITMVLTYFVLKERFAKTQMFGASVIIAGAVLAIMPLFVGDQHEGDGTSVAWYSVVIFVGAQVPASLSGVCKQVLFDKDANMDIFYLTCLVSWTQLASTWLFVPILSLPSFGGIPLSDIPEVFRNGARCFIGDDSIPVEKHGKIIGHCSDFTPRVTMIFSVSGFLAGIFQLLILKEGGAVIMVICQAIALPLANMAFSVRAIMGSQVEDFSWYDVGGLLLVLAGFVTYRYQEIRRARELAPVSKFEQVDQEPYQRLDFEADDFAAVGDKSPFQQTFVGEP